MKVATKKIKERETDDSLFGLLAAYKTYNTYFRVFINEEKKQISFQMTDNPKYFVPVVAEDESERDDKFRMLKRSEMNLLKLCVKYLSPNHVLEFSGDSLGVKVTARNVRVANKLDSGARLFRIDAPVSQLAPLVSSLKKIIMLTPQKKYEIIEKYLANATKTEVEE
jgi:hypothetical protein